MDISAMLAAFALFACQALLSARTDLVPLPEEHSQVLADVRLKIEDVLPREDVGDDLARMLQARAGVEQAALDGHERVV